MSSVFIILYAGWPLRLPALDVTSRDRASQFISEADAWFEIFRAGLDPRHCRVERFEEPLRAASERFYDVRQNANVVQPSEVAG